LYITFCELSKCEETYINIEATELELCWNLNRPTDMCVVNQSVSPSVRPGFEPLIGSHGHILACWEYLYIVCCGAHTLTGGRAFHMRCHSSSVSYIYFLYITSLFLFIFIIFNIYVYLNNNNYYLVFYVHARPVSRGHCAANYAYFIYLRQFRHLNDRTPDRRQV